MLTTSKLTAGERLFIDRRRANETKDECAKAYEVSLYCYNQWEAGEWSADMPTPSLGHLSKLEGYVILRRRAGVTVAELAQVLGTSSWWVTRMEAGNAPADRLLTFWAKMENRVARRGEKGYLARRWAPR